MIKHFLFKTVICMLSIFSLTVTVSSAAFAPGTDIAIITTSPNRMTDNNYMRIVRNNEIIASRLELSENKAKIFYNYRGSKFSYLGDFIDNSEGLEFVIRAAPWENGKKMKIYNDVYQLITEFKVQNKKSSLVVARGDIDPSTSGPEFVFCHYYDQPARIRIFHYDESTNTATKIISFKPFPEQVENKDYNGCADLEIGDINEDGVNEIIVLSNPRRGKEVAYYNIAGEREGGFSFEETTDDIYVLDFDGDGFRDEIAYQGYRDDFYVMNNAGEVVYIFENIIANSIYSSGNIKGVTYGDTDQDGADEIVVMYGKKSNIQILGHGSTEPEVILQVYPNSQKDRHRWLLVTDLSNYID